MATHNIIPTDVEDCEQWNAKSFALPAGVEYMAGHSVDYDWKAIGSPEVRRICTLALARHMWPKADSHTLGACIYNIYPHAQAREMLKNSHGVAADVENTLRLLQTICLALNVREWHSVWQLSEKARVPTHMNFGKYKGLPVQAVPADYVRWLRNQPDTDPYLMKAFAR